MKTTTKITLLAIALLFAGCATTETTLKHVQTNYYGKSLDSLVMEVGTPKSKYVMQSGDIIYKWVYSGTMNMPVTTIYNSSATAYGYGNTVSAYGTGTATTFGGGVSHRVCDMTVLTTKKNIIKRIKFNRDTFGTDPGTASMCAQMFGISYTRI